MSNKIYILLALLTIPAVFLTASVTSNQSPVIKINVSNITLNLIFLFGIWGYFTQWFTEKKKWGKCKSIVFYVASTLCLFIALRFGGLETRW